MAVKLKTKKRIAFGIGLGALVAMSASAIIVVATQSDEYYAKGDKTPEGKTIAEDDNDTKGFIGQLKPADNDIFGFYLLGIPLIALILGAPTIALADKKFNII